MRAVAAVACVPHACQADAHPPPAEEFAEPAEDMVVYGLCICWTTGGPRTSEQAAEKDNVSQMGADVQGP